MNNTTTRISFGRVFEDKMTCATIHQGIREKGFEKAHGYVCTAIDTDCDRLEGWDCGYNATRIDWTLDFENKDHMVKFKKSLYFNKYGIEVNFGIRTANNVTEFPNPVVVIGFKYYCNKWNLIEECEEHISEILNMAVQVRRAWERKCKCVTV